MLKIDKVIIHATCGTQVFSGFCRKCKSRPLGDELLTEFHCPVCSSKLDTNKKCPKCKTTYH